MKKGINNKTYLIIGIVVIVIIALIPLVFLFGNKEKSDNNPVIPANNPNDTNNSVVNNNNPVNNSNNPVINDTVVNRPIGVNISGNYKITLKTKNPQYKQGKEVFFIYEIQNLDNNSLVIPKNVVYGIEIKNSDGSLAKHYDSSDKLIILNEDLTIPSLQKTSNEFSIIGDDFGLIGLNPVEGSYYAVIVNIGSVKSNKVMVRILK